MTKASGSVPKGAEWLTPKEYRFKRYKVIRTYSTFARSKREAVNLVVDGKVEPDSAFAVDDLPKGPIGQIVKQVLG